MEKIKDKNKDEFVEMIGQHKGIVFKIASTYCKGQEDQKDLAQDIIIELWKSFDRYDPQYKLTTWMYKIALNVAISYYRKTLTKKKYISTLDFDFVHIADEEAQEEDDRIRLLKKFIEQLNELNKALMILYLEGNNHQEISEVLHISKSNVGTKISRIKQQLKNYILKTSK